MWQIEICNPDGSTRSVLTPEDPVYSIEWQSRGDGDCLEAAIVGRGLDIRPRDIVAIRARSTPTDPNPPTVRYVGWVVEVPSRRSPDLTTTRLMGGRKRLEEILNRSNTIGGSLSDARSNAYTAAAHVNALGNPRLVAPATSAAFPLQGFKAGQRLPLLEPVAETLEATALMVPGFTVEAGTSYTYDGRTYNPGEAVPPTRWGVRAETAADVDRGIVYFERPTHVPQALDEIADQLDIEWLPRSSEYVVDDVTVVLIEEHNADAIDIVDTSVEPNPAFSRVGQPVTHRLKRSGARYGAELRVSAEGQGLKEAAWTDSATGVRFTNPGSAFDGNLGTYASNSAAAPDPPITHIHEIFRTAWPTTVAWRVRYSSHVPVHVNVLRWVLGTQVTWFWTLPSTRGQQADRYLYTPPHPGLEGIPTTIALSIDPNETADVTRIYEVTPYEPDPDVLNQVAAGHMHLPGSAPAAAITVPNRLLPLAWRWQIALANGESVTGNAELIEHRITAEEGMTTTLHLEQALTSQETASRALLDQRIRRAVRAGAKPTA